MPLTVGLISLGCPKNLVDSEIMIGHLQKAGMTMTPEPELADVMVVNTRAIVPGAIMNCRPIGVLKMQDESGHDEY